MNRFHFVVDLRTFFFFVCFVFPCRFRPLLTRPRNFEWKLFFSFFLSLTHSFIHSIYLSISIYLSSIYPSILVSWFLAFFDVCSRFIWPRGCHFRSLLSSLSLSLVCVCVCCVCVLHSALTSLVSPSSIKVNWELNKDWPKKPENSKANQAEGLLGWLPKRYLNAT